jgi:hypothetical protein
MFSYMTEEKAQPVKIVPVAEFIRMTGDMNHLSLTGSPVYAT